LFFDVPADRVEDYQPFMDFVYSTYISGLPEKLTLRSFTAETAQSAEIFMQ